MASSNKRKQYTENKDSKTLDFQLVSLLIEAERTKGGVKVKAAYLTKDKSAMKKEIDRVKKLKSDDPSAYNKWDADYADKDKTKKYKTKKSAATTAYEKRFGKKK
jgi:hypothetical protein